MGNRGTHLDEATGLQLSVMASGWMPSFLPGLLQTVTRSGGWTAAQQGYGWKAPNSTGQPHGT